MGERHFFTNFVGHEQKKVENPWVRWLVLQVICMLSYEYLKKKKLASDKSTREMIKNNSPNNSQKVIQFYEITW